VGLTSENRPSVKEHVHLFCVLHDFIACCFIVVFMSLFSPLPGFTVLRPRP
ncbi:hypothetical protein XENOCAPTIV_001714, partial [Xenoophorus captivus]